MNYTNTIFNHNLHSIRVINKISVENKKKEKENENKNNFFNNYTSVYELESTNVCG